MLRTGEAKNLSSVVYGTLVLVLAACGSAAEEGGEAGTPGACAAGEPVTREARVEVIATGQGVIGGYSPLEMPALIADASGVYWHDTAGSVFAHPRGQNDVVVLKQGGTSEPNGRSQLVVGITGGGERLYVGDAFLEPATDYFPAPQFDPPGRLLSYPKAGGPPEVLLELEDSTIYPFAADGGRVIALVIGPDGNGGYFEVDPANPRLERLQMRRTPGGYLELSGDTLYWSDSESPPNLVRTGFDDPDPEVLGPLRSGDFDVGPGYVLSLEERFLEADSRVAQNFVLHTAATANRPLPGAGALISLERALDAGHVYWYSYIGYDGSVPVEEYDPSLELVRVDISCGTLEQVATPGLVPEASTEILGQYGDTLYIKNGSELFAVQKP